MLTNLFGFQVGGHKMFQKIVRPPNTEGVLLKENPLYYGAGLMIAVPWVERMIVQAGPLWTNDPSRSIGFEVRGTVDVLSWKGRRHFGIP
jgi:hypothetical protein